MWSAQAHEPFSLPDYRDIGSALARMALPAEMTSTLESSTLSILFCGHFAYHMCLRKWLAENDTCPFCRKGLRHENCGHTVEPRPVTKHNVISIPRTRPAGGKVADTCRRCHRRAVGEKAREKLKMLVKRYVQVRDAGDDDDDDDEEAKSALSKAQTRLERFKQDLDYDEVIRNGAW